jgi:hypothetical protein
MAKNSDAIYKALRGGLRQVKDDIPSVGKDIVQEFQVLLLSPSPPASRPGEPPHARTGAYARSIKSRVSGSTITVYASGKGAQVGVWMEFGTHQKGKPHIAPRPHWRTRLPEISARHLSRLAASLIQGERQ